MLNAVALAGGFTYRAAQDSVTVKRGGANAQAGDRGRRHADPAGRHHRGAGALLLSVARAAGASPRAGTG